MSGEPHPFATSAMPDVETPTTGDRALSERTTLQPVSAKRQNRYQLTPLAGEQSGRPSVESPSADSRSDPTVSRRKRGLPGVFGKLADASTGALSSVAEAGVGLAKHSVGFVPVHVPVTLGSGGDGFGFFFEEASLDCPPLKLACVLEGSAAASSEDLHHLVAGATLLGLTKDAYASAQHGKIGDTVDVKMQDATQAQLVHVLSGMSRPVTFTFSKHRGAEGAVEVLSESTASGRFGGRSLDAQLRSFRQWASVRVHEHENTLTAGGHKFNSANQQISDMMTSAKAIRMLMKMEKVDQRRLKLMEAGANLKSHWSALWHWTGTVLPDIFKSPTFIVSFALYFCIIALLKYDIWTFDVGNVSSYLGPVTGFIMFFSVFYNNQCYIRWTTQINTVFAARKKLFATATLLRANVDVRDQRGQELMIKLVGYLNAAVIVTFTGISLPGDHLYDEFFFRTLANKHKLLTHAEMAKIMALDPGGDTGDANRELVMWAFNALNAVHRRQPMMMPVYSAISNSILSVQDSITALFDHNKHPIPFGYYNMLSWLLFFYLPMNSMMFALANVDRWYFAWVPVFFVDVCLLGLTALARKFNAPFGSKVEGFPVNHFLDCTCTATTKQLASDMNSEGILEASEHARFTSTRWTAPASARKSKHDEDEDDDDGGE